MNLATTLSSHQGSPLEQNDSFRVLYLEPGQENDMISVKLVNSQLSESLPYEALSYTWGDASQTAVIQVSSDLDRSEPTTQRVTINCWLALRRLRRARECRALWIDAICINQASTTERNHQLGLMAKIYAKASAVVVYLGEGDEESDTAMDTIASIVDSPDYQPIDPTVFSRHLRNEKRVLSTAPDNCVASLFQHPWFSRTWVLQEITYAQRATVYCGSKELPWQSFIDFVYYMVASRWSGRLPFAVQYSARKSPPRWSHITPRLLSMLVEARSCGATDPRDKLFAFVPLLERQQQVLHAQYPESSPESAQQAPIDVPTLLSGVLLNYSHSASDVFVSLAVYFLKHVGLNILRQVAGPSHLGSLPSWAPDWSQPPQSNYREIKSTALSHNAFGIYEAEPGSPSVWEYRASSFHELRVRAINCGVVKSIGGLCDIDYDQFPLSQWRQLVPQECLEDSSFERLIVADRLFSESVVRVVLDRISEYESEKSACVEEMAPTSNLSLRTLIVMGLSGSGLVQAKHIRQACDKRRLFVTDGQKIGLAPESTQEGDFVFVIAGTNVPFVLRKVTLQSEADDNYYKLIGECHIQGTIQKQDIQDESVLESITII